MKKINLKNPFSQIVNFIRPFFKRQNLRKIYQPIQASKCAGFKAASSLDRYGL